MRPNPAVNTDATLALGGGLKPGGVSAGTGCSQSGFEARSKRSMAGLPCTDEARELVPRGTKVGVLTNPTKAGEAPFVVAICDAARR